MLILRGLLRNRPYLLLEVVLLFELAFIVFVKIVVFILLLVEDHVHFVGKRVVLGSSLLVVVC